MSSAYLTLNVVELTHETPDAVTIHFEHPDRQAVACQPGQFLTLILPCGPGGKKERRAYSLSSTPAEAPRLAVTVKRVSGGLVSNYLLDTVRVGQQVEVMAPLGNFTLTPQPNAARSIVLVGAGSGITPLMSMLKAVLREEPRSQVLLVYGNRNEQSVIFAEQLRRLEQQYAGRLQVEHVYSQPITPTSGHQHTGRLNRTMLLRILEQRHQFPAAQAEYYLCGPEGMMTEAYAALELLGVPASRIRRESFVAAADASETAAAQPSGHGDVSTAADDTPGAYTVTIHYEGSEYQVAVAPNQTILEAALDQDIDLPYSCQAGLCTACRGKCLSGKVHLDEREGLSDSEIKQGYVLTCVGHPLTADVVIEID
ncbi:ring-1,2-phenylacetyl-CoA epoxidase subunit PaaE [Hymenobacter luteus]|uniref:Ring-1,2-phenylacetyl-CoA epoxidase subunit PaaE n=2 Tax=Hymenobacter TaxID=89966 RepID=A0A7W9T3M2_9BACT|nr:MULTISPECIES: ferredoxin--NADP reductase [Hymenobacter]MBB4603050.1 ring-1,2-phenylacetyl-CoA epoxidase subunit PaaE [Hymenobacter latericoloratus]MBB6060991.1 ring-1,2-phenylacetyl-CoA epoxidase subunit PaaE [Hymenobacter luteus]